MGIHAQPVEAGNGASGALARALEHPRYEVFPLAGIEEEVAEHVPRHATITITASPRWGMAPTLELAQRLALLGFTVAPHVSARLVADDIHLKDILDQFAVLGIREAFVIGGDSDRPAGPFASALELLVAMKRLGHRLAEIGIAGYPESHPKIPDDVTIQAMWDKRHYATYIVSQVCFDARVVGRWVDRVRHRGVDLPIYVGIPGPTAIGRLLRTSRRIGVGESVRFLAGHRMGMLRLAQPGSYRPDRLVTKLAPYIRDPQNRIQGLHMYTFNGVTDAERWRQATLTRLQAG